jgi:nitrile hydratase accessory protein
MPSQLDVDGPAAPPRRNGELAFSEPWESRSFGLAVALEVSGVIDWEAFRQQLMSTIGAWERSHHTEDEIVVNETVVKQPWGYWRCWQNALERLLLDIGVLGVGDVDSRAEQLAARAPGHDHEHEHRP